MLSGNAHLPDRLRCGGLRPLFAGAGLVLLVLSATLRSPAVVGGVPVYFDGSHLSNTYARTLGPFLDPKMQAALATP